MADITVPVYRATVYPFKFMLAPANSAGINMFAWYFVFIAAVGIKALNSLVLLPLIGLPITHGLLLWISTNEPHFDTVVTTYFVKNKVNMRLKLLSKHERGKAILYPS